MDIIDLTKDEPSSTKRIRSRTQVSDSVIVISDHSSGPDNADASTRPRKTAKSSIRASPGATIGVVQKQASLKSRTISSSVPKTPSGASEDAVKTKRTLNTLHNLTETLPLPSSEAVLGHGGPSGKASPMVKSHKTSKPSSSVHHVHEGAAIAASVSKGSSERSPLLSQSASRGVATDMSRGASNHQLTSQPSPKGSALSKEQHSSSSKGTKDLEKRNSPHSTITLPPSHVVAAEDAGPNHTEYPKARSAKRAIALLSKTPAKSTKSRFLRKTAATQPSAIVKSISLNQEIPVPELPQSTGNEKQSPWTESRLGTTSDTAQNNAGDSNTSEDVKGPKDMVRRGSALSSRLSSPSPKTVVPGVEPTGVADFVASHVSTIPATQPELESVPTTVEVGGLPKPLARLGKLRTGKHRSPVEMTPDSLTEGVSSPITRTTLAEVETKLKRHIAAFKDSHEAYVKSLLHRQRKALDTKQDQTRNVGNGNWMQNTSPFNLSGPQGRKDKVEAPIRFPLVLNFKTVDERTKVPSGTLSPITYKTTGPDVPPYAFHHRLRSNVLAPNQKFLAAGPHSDTLASQPEKMDDFWDDLGEVFTDGVPDEEGGFMVRCEKSKQLRPAIENFLAEIESTAEDIISLYVCSDNAMRTLAGVPKVSALRKQAAEESTHLSSDFGEWSSLAETLTAPTAEACETAQLACAAFQKVLGFSIWPIVQPRARELLIAIKASQKGDTGLGRHVSLACRTCHTYCCTCHGEIREQEDSGSSGEENANDALGWNYSHPMVGGRYQQMITRHSDVQVTPKSRPSSRRVPRSGSSRSGRASARASPELTTEKSVVENHSPPGAVASPGPYRCSKACALDTKALNARSFIDVEETLRRFTPAERSLARDLLAAFDSSERCSCLISMALKKECVHVYHLIRMLRDMKPGESSDVDEEPTARRDWKWWMENPTTEITERKPFYPCSHEGRCEDAECRCFREKVSCEKACACSKSCSRRYGGCNCARVGSICWQNDRCDCNRLQRECDPDICGRCGASEVLDPENRHVEGIAEGRCANVSIQRGRPKRVLIGSSQVAGFGLFAGEAIKASSFLGEYTGEVISKGEAIRRKTFYQHFPREYTFELNAEQELDGTHAGGKLRFVNNSNVPANQNCFQSHLLCNMQTRIGLFASRDLKAGEELFFEYGYPPEKMKGFRELKAATPAPVVAVKKKRPRKKTLAGTGTRGLKQGREVEGSSGKMLSNVSEHGGEQLDAEEDAELRAIIEQQGMDDEDWDGEGEMVGSGGGRSSSPEALQQGSRARKRKRRGGA